jgi:hypothetical protein
LGENLQKLRTKVWWTSGLMLPPPAVFVENTLERDAYQWRIWEMPVGQGRCVPVPYCSRALRG